MPIPSDLTIILKTVFDVQGYTYTNPILELESQEYGACTFLLNAMSVKFRSAKITPTKAGQFVTLWKRDAAGHTKPHEASDAIDLFIIGTRRDERLGQFVFPKSILLEEGILTSKTKPGKRGFRVYPSWDAAENKQAQASQHWQLDYFLEMEDRKVWNEERMQLLCKKI